MNFTRLMSSFAIWLSERRAAIHWLLDAFRGVSASKLSPHFPLSLSR